MANLNLLLKYGERDVRTAGTQERPEFIANDACAVLGLENTSRALATIPARHKGVTIRNTPGGPQEMITVTEAGLYRLIFKSRKPEAEAFQEWVTNEVLPCIRKYGTYPAPVGASGFVQMSAEQLQRQQGEIEHLKRAVDRLAAALEPRPAAIVAPALPRFSVLGRLQWRGLGRLTRDARRKIHRIAVGRVEECSEEPLCQAGGEGNGGPSLFAGTNLVHLDYAIDKVLEQIEAQRRADEAKRPALFNTNANAA